MSDIDDLTDLIAGQIFLGKPLPSGPAGRIWAEHAATMARSIVEAGWTAPDGPDATVLAFPLRAAPLVETLDDELVRLRAEHDQVADLLAYLDLHIGTYEWKVLTTEEKELMADLIDESRRNMAAEEGQPISMTPRWWRDDYVGVHPYAR
jgi:hypothetical protein